MSLLITPSLLLQIFDGLRRSAPSQLEKLVAVPGDIMQPGLGLNSADRARLEQEVSGLGKRENKRSVTWGEERTGGQ